MIESKNKSGKTYVIDLSDPQHDFEYNGIRLEKDTLEYTLQSVREEIELKIVEQGHIKRMYIEEKNESLIFKEEQTFTIIVESVGLHNTQIELKLSANGANFMHQKNKLINNILKTTISSDIEKIPIKITSLKNSTELVVSCSNYVKGSLEASLYLGKSYFALNGDMEIAKSDIKSILPKSHQSGFFVDETDGKVYLKEKYNWGYPDPGVKLISDLVSSEKLIEYNVADKVTTLSYLDKRPRLRLGRVIENSYDLKTGEDNNQLINASKTPTYEGVPYDVPQILIDGQVTIAKSTDNLMRIFDNCTPKPRASLVFHEIKENYQRTVKKQDYKMAHKTAIETEKNFGKNDPRRDFGNEGKASNSINWYKKY